MTDRQPGICVCPVCWGLSVAHALSWVRAWGARLVQRGVVDILQFSQVVAGGTLLNAKELVGLAQ